MIDIKNAFNSIPRDVVLEEARRRIPALFNLLWQAYSKDSFLFYGENKLLSSTGIQQGDPAGPALFALGIDPIIRKLTSELSVWYLNDGTIAGLPESLLNDLNTFIPAFRHLGMEINNS